MSDTNVVAEATDETGWLPGKPADQYSDEEVRELDVFKSFRQYARLLPEDQVLAITRDTISKMWQAAQSRLLRPEILTLAARVRELGLEVGTHITVNLDDGSYSVAKPAGDRFKGKDYAQFIGQTFTHEVKQARTPSKNGKYILEVREPIPGSQKLFSARLIQQNGNKNAPIIQFPPADPEKPQATAKLVEVKSMSDMMKASDVASPLTPGVYFKLREKLNKSSNDDESNEDDDADEDEDETPASGRKSQAHAALDDDED